MFTKTDENNYKIALEGVFFKTLVHGSKTLLSKFQLKKGSTVPRHTHPHEQTGYLISGQMKFTIGDEKFDAGPGDSWCIPGNFEHGVEVLEDTTVIEVFSPVRQEYLPQGFMS